MIRYPLRDLMTVRKHRVDRATEAVAAARRDLKRAEQFLQSASEELKKFKRHMITREIELYQAIMGKPIPIGKLDEVKHEIQIMKQDELERQHRELEAMRAVELAAEQLRLAIENHTKAMRAESKLFEHKSIWLREQLLDQQRQEDLEVEDISFQHIHARS